MNSVFVYNDIMKEKIQQTLKLEPINEILGETEGKLYKISRIPIMLNLHDITHNRGTRRVLGSVLSFNDDDMEKVLYTLDNYHGCSLSRIGIYNPCDLMYRVAIQVYPIIFNNIHELKTYRYKYDKPINCYAYLGNTKHDSIIYELTINRHNKLLDGVYKQGMIDVLQRKNYINKSN